MNRTEIVKSLIEKTGMNTKAFAEKIGIPYTTLYSILERGVEKASISNVLKVYRELGVTAEDVERMAEGEIGIGESIMQSSLIPIVGRIACGNGTLAFEEIEGYESAPKDIVANGEHFYLRAHGDSMIGAGIHDKDLVLIRKQPSVDNGQIAAVLLDDDEAVLKRLYRSDGQIVLQSENNAYAPIFAPPANAKVIGRAVQVTKKL